MNSTTCSTFLGANSICYQLTDVPFYHTDRSALIPGIPDNLLALASPVIGYWLLALFFHGFDVSGWEWLHKYRIHESAEAKKRNLATRSEVIWTVLFQHALQTMLGLVILAGDVHSEPGSWRGEMENVGTIMESVVRAALGRNVGEKALRAIPVDMVYFLYWWGIPAAQFCLAMFVIDTWQYFFHRFEHMNRFLYRKIHFVHHKIYAPYAFGALYNHPVEGFLLDSLGVAMARTCAGITARQAILFFTFASLKVVDDHCGYRLPFDPFQMMSANNADYHDIHHQAIGIKSNFSAPFFVHWDDLLGTRMTRKDIELHRQKISKSL